MVVDVKPIAGPFTLGEGPHWDATSQSLYFVDIDGRFICNYKSGTVTKCAIDRKVGFIVPVDGKSNQFLIGYGGDFAIVTWDGKSETPEDLKIYTKGDSDPDNRINDGKADPTGRIYAGSMCGVKINNTWQKEKCFLYTLNNGEAKVCMDKVGLSNGLAWSLDEKKMYYIDSLETNIREMDYKKETGEIGIPKVVYTLNSNQGSPDGMTIDSDGKLWVASFGGARVIRIDPETKQLLTTIDVPAHQTTSVAFGGPNYDELYVTSANYPEYIPEDEKSKYSHNGYLFKITGLGVKGLPPTQAKI